MRIGKIVSSAEYRMDKHFQNLLIFGIFIVGKWKKNSANWLVFQIVKYWEFISF